MKRSYFLRYGSLKNKEEIKALLEQYWHITCLEHDSYYFGLYYSYSGYYADKLTIKDKESEFSPSAEYRSLIDISFTQGENGEKQNRYEFIKNAFSQRDIALVISDKCIEEL